ncbi:MAG: alpha/beta fold hydrolase [Hyphomonadaceae bacterium]
MDETGSKLAAWLKEGLSHHPTEGAIIVDGAAVAYRGWGLSAREKPALVLMHGFQAHAQWWDHIGPRLSDHFRVVAFSFTGMGDSGHRDRYSRAIHARELFALCDTLDMPDAIPIAHSYGAMVTLEASLMAPDRFKRAILIEIWLDAIAERHAGYPLSQKRYFPDLETALGRFRFLPPSAWPHPVLLEYVKRHSFKETPEGWTWKFDERSPLSLNEDQGFHALSAAKLPFDFIYGELTDVMDHSHIARVHEIMPACRASLGVPLAHHHAILEQPAAFLMTLRALLAHP